MKEKVKNFIKSNKWILLGSFVLLVWKIFLTYTMWHGRLIPPEPDDSYIYITHIESVRMCPSIFFCENPIYSMGGYSGYLYFIYSLFFGYLAIILNISSETMFHWSFYIGSIFLIPVLWVFLKSLRFNKNLIAFTFLFAILPHGGGGTHSFAWMVPSYFALLFILLIYSIIIGQFKKWKLYLIILIPLAIYTHTISIYLILISILYTFIISILNKKIERDIFKKLGFSLIIAFLVYAPLSIYLSHKNNTLGNPYGIESFLTESIKTNTKGFSSISKEIRNNKNFEFKTKKYGIFPGYPAIKYNYLQLFVFNPLGLLALVIFTSVLLYFRKFEIISMFFSSLIFVIISSINYYGFRALLLLWPLTFIFYSAGFWYCLKLISRIEGKRLSFLAKLVVSIGLVIIFAVGVTFSYLYHTFNNEEDNIFVDKKFVAYLEKNTFLEEKIFYSNHLLKYIQLTYGSKKLSFTNSVELAKYYVYIEMNDSDTFYESSKLNKFIDSFYSLVAAKRERYGNSNNANKNMADSEKNLIKEKFRLEKNFGRIKIYKNSDYL